MESGQTSKKIQKLAVGRDRITAELRFMSNWIISMNLSSGLEAAKRVIQGQFTVEDATIVRKTVADFNRTRLCGLESI